MNDPVKKERQVKPKIEINRRTVSGKKKPDLFAKFRNDEHPLDGIVPEAKDNPTLDYPRLLHPTLDETTTPYPRQQTEPIKVEETKKSDPSVLRTSVSPTKNFTKVSNSLIKQAIPDGLFKGQSKHTYDVLYLATRGAINPKRQIQLTKTELVRLTGLESKTIQRHLSHLRSTGLIIVDPKIGDHKGAIYEVRVPEEITLPYPTLPQTSTDETSIYSTPNRSIEDTTLGLGNNTENTTRNIVPKTSLKTNTIDDDLALTEFITKIEAISWKLTGKGFSGREASKWGKLADLLILELEAAASRTSGISSVPAFLTEVLRRQFFASKQNRANQPAPNSKSPARIKPDTVGKSDLATGETFEINPLDDESREAALVQLQEFAGESFLGDFAKWYTPSDWQWLTERLNHSSAVTAQDGADTLSVKETPATDFNDLESKKVEIGD